MLKIKVVLRIAIWAVLLGAGYHFGGTSLTAFGRWWAGDSWFPRSINIETLAGTTPRLYQMSLADYEEITRFVPQKQPAKFRSLVEGAWGSCVVYYGEEYCKPLFAGYLFRDPPYGNEEKFDKIATEQFKQLQVGVTGREKELLLTVERKATAVEQWVKDIKEKKLWAEFVGERHLASHLPVEFNEPILVTSAGWSLYPSSARSRTLGFSMLELVKVAPELFVSHNDQLQLLKERRLYEASLLKEDRLLSLLLGRLLLLNRQATPMMLTRGWSEGMKPDDAWQKMVTLGEPHQKILRRYWEAKGESSYQELDIFQDKSFRDTRDNEAEFKDYIKPESISSEVKATALGLIEIQRPDLFPTKEHNEKRRSELFEAGRLAYRQRYSEAKRKEIIGLVLIDDRSMELLRSMEVTMYSSILNNEEEEVCKQVRVTDFNELGCKVKTSDYYRPSHVLSNPETFVNWQLLALAAWFEPEVLNGSVRK